MTREIQPHEVMPLGSQWAAMYEEDPETGAAVFSPERLAEWQREQARRLNADEETR